MIEAEEASLAESLHNMCLGAGLIWTKKVAKAAAALGKEAAPNRVKITACTEPSRGPPGTTDVIVYPEVEEKESSVLSNCGWSPLLLLSCTRSHSLFCVHVVSYDAQKCAQPIAQVLLPDLCVVPPSIPAHCRRATFAEFPGPRLFFGRR